MEFVIASVAAVALILWASEPETLEERARRETINRMADRARRERRQSVRRPCRYGGPTYMRRRV